MVTVFFQGTFDIINVGHVRAFRLARKQGDKLIVGLNSDSLVRWYKKREPIIPFTHRKEIVLALEAVDQVIECHEPAAIRYLRRLKADVFITHEEWEEQQYEAINWMRNNGRKVVYSPRTTDIDSSHIRARVIEEGT